MMIAGLQSQVQLFKASCFGAALWRRLLEVCRNRKAVVDCGPGKSFDTTSLRIGAAAGGADDIALVSNRDFIIDQRARSGNLSCDSVPPVRQTFLYELVSDRKKFATQVADKHRWLNSGRTIVCIGRAAFPNGDARSSRTRCVRSFLRSRRIRKATNNCAPLDSVAMLIACLAATGGRCDERIFGVFGLKLKTLLCGRELAWPS